MNKKFIFIVFLFGLIRAQSISISPDTAIVTFHSTLIKNKKVEYSATTGTQPVWDKNGKPIADANIVLLGTNHGSKTDNNGSFMIANLKDDSYNLKVSFIGYENYYFLNH